MLRRALVDYRAVAVSPTRIRLARPGMAVTLNGIAQGDITDRVADLLRAECVEHTLVNLGEYRALGAHPTGRAWKVGIKDPHDAAALADKVDLTDRAIATSAVTGTVFDPHGRRHHLFDPAVGRPARGLTSASVIARNARDADACSTAMLATSEPLKLDHVASFGVEWAFAIDAAGTNRTWMARA